jgi:type IV secretory pathway protease TraF
MAQLRVQNTIWQSGIGVMWRIHSSSSHIDQIGRTCKSMETQLMALEGILLPHFKALLSQDMRDYGTVPCQRLGL